MKKIIIWQDSEMPKCRVNLRKFFFYPLKMVIFFYQIVIEFKNFDEKLTSLGLKFRFDGCFRKKSYVHLLVRRNSREKNSE